MTPQEIADTHGDVRRVKKRRNTPPATRDDITPEMIAADRKAGLTREDMAKKYNCSLATIRRIIREARIPRPRREKAPRKPLPPPPPARELTPWERAKKLLGPRLTLKNGSYYLDNVPMSVQRLLAAADVRVEGVPYFA